MLRKKWIAFFVILTFLSNFIIPNARAELEFQPEKFPFKEMQIQVMPEFDYPDKWPQNTPSLLVGMYGTITNKSGQDYTGDIEIPVPSSEKDFQTNLVAEFPDPTKPEVQRPYNLDNQKGVVSWKPEKPIKNNETYKFVIEYYVNSINVSDKKNFTYSFTNPADIDQLNVIFYSPMNAKEVALDPKPQNTTKSDYGEDLYYYQYQSIKKGQNLKYTFTYKKDGTESTLAVINKMQPPNDSNHSGVKSGDTQKATSTNAKQPIIGIWGALIIGLAIIIAGVFVYFGLKGKNSIPAKGRKTTKPQSKKGTRKNDSKSANDEEKKELRKKLLTGKIDQETYEEEMKKLI
jgi:hypothetical protein